jgi:hypothetical protein
MLHQSHPQLYGPRTRQPGNSIGRQLRVRCLFCLPVSFHYQPASCHSLHFSIVSFERACTDKRFVRIFVYFAMLYRFICYIAQKGRAVPNYKLYRTQKLSLYRDFAPRSGDDTNIFSHLLSDYLLDLNL